MLTGDIQNNATYGPDGAMDWDGTNDASTHALQTDARMGYTWRSNTSSYPSGLLDHMLYTDAAATLAKSFILRTEVMPPATLSALGLNSNCLLYTSDAADERSSVDLVGRLIIKKKKQQTKKKKRTQ